LVSYRDHTVQELSFLIDEYGFDKPIRKNHDNMEFSFTWKKGEIEVEIKWEMYQSRSAPFPEFKITHPTIEKSFKKILDAYSGCCYNKYHRHEKIRNKWIFSSKVNDRRNDILAELFRQRLDVFTRLVKENDYYLKSSD
jgi:hypothetical protein